MLYLSRRETKNKTFTAKTPWRQEQQEEIPGERDLVLLGLLLAAFFAIVRLTGL
jgi:hypothetical protein